MVNLKLLYKELFSKNTLLYYLSSIIGSYIIFVKYDDPVYLTFFFAFLLIFIWYWDDPDKFIWIVIFILLTVTMLIIENLVIIFTQKKAISYNAQNLFKNVPYWLIIAYWNTLIFIVFNYRLLKLITT